MTQQKEKVEKFKIIDFVVVVAEVNNLIKIKLKLYSCANIHEFHSNIAVNH